jgi:hypothetical protein
LYNEILVEAISLCRGPMWECHLIHGDGLENGRILNVSVVG